MRKRIAIFLAATMMVASFTGCGSSGAKGENGELNVFIWTEYVSESAISAFEEESGIKVNVSTYSSNEDMLAKLKSEAEGTYDVVLPSDYAVEYLIAQEKLETLDKDALTNLSNISETYMNPSYDPGNIYSVPYEGGVCCIAVNTDKVNKQITSYDDLFDESLADSIVVLDDFRAIIGLTERSMGLSMNETDPTTLSEVEEKLLKLKNNVKLYDSDSPKSALISGDCSIGAVWSAEAALAMEENPAIEVVYPKEGAYVFMDNWSIPKGAKNYDNALSFINYMLSADAAKMNIEDFPYLCPNDAALEMMGDDYVANEAKNIPAGVISSGEFVKYLDSDSLAIYDEMWTKLKE
ncbi:MAG: spermidine/putrescine ABC transporter substrate-binding protein [Lachnospiraceae bacterium]|nr:spermidine/putrescine ABC transporter substrate-binding protein [Lachnospiraceae bacterium]